MKTDEMNKCKLLRKVMRVISKLRFVEYEPIRHLPFASCWLGPEVLLLSVKANLSGEKPQLHRA